MHRVVKFERLSSVNITNISNLSRFISRFDLMMSCWSYDPTARPSFTVCLTELANLQDKLQQSPFTAVHNGHYIGSESVYRKYIILPLYFYIFLPKSEKLAENLSTKVILCKLCIRNVTFVVWVYIN